MKEAMKWLLSGIFLLVGVLEMNMLLIGLGVACLLGLVGGLLFQANGKRKQQERHADYAARLERYLEANKQLVVNDHITIKSDKEINDYDDAYIYFDGEMVAPLKDFAGTPEVYDRLASPILKLEAMIGFIDNNNNGIDDRLEEKINGAYFVKQIGKQTKYIDHPGILAGLKEICELLNTIDMLEGKYPRITPRLRKLYKDYLPLLIDILTQYAVLEEKQATSQEIASMEIKLEKTVLLTSEAIKTIMTNFANEDMINMKADITVLETILKKDGLVKEGQI